MTTRNEHTGDLLRTKACNKKYADNWDRIFNKKKDDKPKKKD